MTDAQLRDPDEISLFQIGTILLRQRRRIVLWALVGIALTLPIVVTKRAVYSATASFIPQGSDDSRSALAGIAGEFGVSLGGSGGAASPDFYLQLLRSRVLLEPIAQDTFVVREMGGKRMTFFQLFQLGDVPSAAREEQALKTMQHLVSPSLAPANVIQVSATTQWPSVSLALVQKVIDGINAYNEGTRQGQAGAELKFVQEQLASAQIDLRAAEDRVAVFLESNRQMGQSPQLALEYERLQRVVATKQAVATTLTQEYEDARIREVRNTPAISMFEPPSVSTRPDPRGRLALLVLGLMLGGIVGSALSIGSAVLQRHRSRGDTDAEAFVVTLSEMGKPLLAPGRWLGRAHPPESSGPRH